MAAPQLEELLRLAFGVADSLIAALQQRGLIAQSLLVQSKDAIRVALVGTGLALALCVPLILVYKLFASEHGRIPRLDVTLTPEEAAENKDKKWVRS